MAPLPPAKIAKPVAADDMDSSPPNATVAQEAARAPDLDDLVSPSISVAGLATVASAAKLLDPSGSNMEIKIAPQLEAPVLAPTIAPQTPTAASLSKSSVKRATRLTAASFLAAPPDKLPSAAVGGQASQKPALITIVAAGGDIRYTFTTGVNEAATAQAEVSPAPSTTTADEGGNSN